MQEPKPTNQPELFTINPEALPKTPVPQAQPDGSHEDINATPHGGEPVTHEYSETTLSDAYTPQYKTEEDEAEAPRISGKAPTYPPRGILSRREPEYVDAGTPDYSDVHPAELDSPTGNNSSMWTPPSTSATPVTAPEQHSKGFVGFFGEHKKATKITSALAGVAALAGIGVAVSTGGNNHKTALHPRVTVSSIDPRLETGANALPSPKTSTETTAPTSVPTEILPRINYPDVVSGEVIQGGNVVTIAQVPGEKTIPINWTLPNNVQAAVPVLRVPGNYDPVTQGTYTEQDLSLSVVEQLAALMTFSPSSPEYQAIMANFTDKASVANYIAKKTLDEFGSNPSDSEVVIYDTDTDPVTVEDSGSLDNEGNTIFAATGSLYVRRLNRNCLFGHGGCHIAAPSNPSQRSNFYAMWQDPRAFVPTESQPLDNFRYSYVVAADGSVKIRNIGFSFDHQ